MSCYLCEAVYLGRENFSVLCDRPWIEIDGNVLDPSDPENPDTINRIYVGTSERESWEGGVHVHGDMGGQIVFNGTMKGTRIYIDGLLKANVDSLVGSEIEIAAISYRVENDYHIWGAIVVNADGFDPADEPNGNWCTGAVVTVNEEDYTGHDYDDHVLNIIPTCVCDVDYDGDIDGDDWDVYGYVPFDYDWRFPGLAPCRTYFSDGNGDGSWDPYNAGGQWYPYQSDDTPYLDAVVTVPCCLSVIPDHLCLGDIVLSGDIDLSDLSALLAGYGMTSGATYDDGDLDGDGDVDLADLATLLAVYGDICTCPPGDGEGGGGGEDDGGGGEDGGSYVDVTVVAYDTGGHTGGGFNGEVDHFVFDLKIEVNDPNNDDWIVTGAVLDTSNDATFQLSMTATLPNQYATFVAAPWTTLPALPNASVVGAYDPPDPDEVFTTTDLNLGWFDTAESNDGPATVMRIVIDVSEVKGADVSEGFGSVYFGNKIGEDDILVADLASGTYTAESAPNEESLSGSFWVKGE